MKLKTLRKQLKLLVLILMFALGFTFHLSPAFAQQVSLAISPPIIESLIKPGKSILIAYRIENFGDPVILSSYIRTFEPKDNRGNITIKDEAVGPIRFSLDNADLALEQPFFLKTLDSKQLLLRMRVPEGAPPGDYYYTLILQTEPPPSVSGSSHSRAKATIGSNILITVSNTGKLEVKPKIILFDVLSSIKIPFVGKNIRLFDSSNTIPVVLIVKNQGSNLIKPQGEILLRGNFGERASFDILPKNILADSERYVSASPSAEIDCESDRAKTECKNETSLLIKGFFVGKYNLSTSVNFGEGTPTLFASISFISLPFKFIIGLLVSIGIAFLVIRRIKNKTEV